MVGWACAAAFMVLLLLHGKAYYIGPIYPVLFAAGAAALGSAARATRFVLFGLISLFGLWALPFGLPILPPAMMARYAGELAPKTARMTNRGEYLPLPQDYADMLGWEEQVSAVAQVFNKLPPDKRSRASLMAANYGQAGALEFFGPRHGLRAKIWLPNNTTLWGPGSSPPEIVVSIGYTEETMRQFFGEVEPGTRFDHPWMVTEERHAPIVVAEKPLPAFQEFWSANKARRGR
jgi:hypothetical protein